MAAAWDLSDPAIQQLTNGMRDNYVAIFDFTVHLYKNNYSPVPGADLADFTEANFAGYSAQVQPASEWGPIAVVDHIGIVSSDIVLSFVAVDGAGFPQTIYGYYVTSNEDDSYAWAERFSTPKDIEAGDVLRITPQMRMRVYPAFG